MKHPTSKASRKLAIAAAVAIIAIAVTGAAYFAQGWVDESRAIPMEIKVENRLAFNLDADALRFGAAPPGSSAERSIEIKNFKPYSLKVGIYATGMIAEWLRSYDNYFVVSPLEAKNVTFVVDVPGEVPLGNYSGTLLIEMKRVWA